MRNIFLTIIVCLLTLPTKAQQIMPIEEYNNSEERIPDGTYIKDVNNLLNKYTGTWIGSYDNKEYTLKIKKSTIEFLGIMNDVLLIRYKMTDVSGNEIRNTFNLSDNASAVIQGFGFQEENENIYWLTYTGVNIDEIECGDSGRIYLDISQNQKKIELYATPADGLLMEINCPNGVFDPPFPFPGDDRMILTKQNIPKKKIGN